MCQGTSVVWFETFLFFFCFYFQLKIDIQLLARLHSGLANFKSGWCESVSNKLFQSLLFLFLSPFVLFPWSVTYCLSFFLSSFFLFLCVYVSVCLVAHNFRNLVVLEVSFKSQLNVWHKFDLLSTPQSRLRNLRVT